MTDKRETWTGDDSEALHHLDPNFTDTGGLMQPKPGYTPTSKDYAALYYLCNEWDYAYDSTPKMVRNMLTIEDVVGLKKTDPNFQQVAKDMFKAVFSTDNPLNDVHWSRDSLSARQDQYERDFTDAKTRGEVGNRSFPRKIVAHNLQLTPESNIDKLFYTPPSPWLMYDYDRSDLTTRRMSVPAPGREVTIHKSASVGKSEMGAFFSPTGRISQEDPNTQHPDDKVTPPPVGHQFIAMDLNESELRLLAHTLHRGDSIMTEGVNVTGCSLVDDMLTLCRMEQHDKRVLMVTGIQTISSSAALAAMAINNFGAAMMELEPMSIMEGSSYVKDQKFWERSSGDFNSKYRNSPKYVSDKERLKKKLAKKSKRRNRK